jgi:L-threonylcarbamoyladenylate synthase
MSTAVQTAAQSVLNGGVIIYPTDTVYGLGADATNPAAVARVRTIKGRDADKPILAMVRDIAMLEEYAVLTPMAQVLARALLPGPLTLVLTQRGEGLNPVAQVDGSVGFRIPNHPTCRALMEHIDRPVTSTSVNKSGLPQPHTLPAMLAQLGEHVDLIDQILDEGPLTPSPASTIVDARGDEPRILREGPIPESRLRAILATG